MKSFFKIFFSSCLGILVGLFVFLFVGFALITGAIVNLTKSKTDQIEIKDHTVLKLNMYSLPEIAIDSPWDNLFGDGDDTPVSLTNVVQSIQKAKENKNIQGIYLNVENISAGVASIDVVRNALLDFKKSGKFIVAYGDTFSQKAYLLASVADKIILNPQGAVNLVGLAANSLMYKDALSKLGVEMEVFKVGKFKGAVEPYVLNKLSDANRSQIQAFVNGIWQSMTTDIALDRKINRDSLLAFVDRGGAFDDAQAFVKMHLVDTLAYRTDVESIVSHLMGNPNKVHMVTVQDMETIPLPYTTKDNAHKIAVVYAEGEIMPSSDESIYDSNTPSISYKLVDRLEQLKKDKDVKAVVLRVNSPGGSAFLSEQIWKAIMDLKKEKPLVVSMGDLAASGGYYISSAANYIVAEPNTLTGSIGIFGMVPNASELAQKVGINVDVVKTSPFADLNMSQANIATLLKPMTPEEKTMIQNEVNRGYKTFLSRVAEGRHMTTEQVDSIGQGHVWLGSVAKKIGLVDKLGGLQIAISKAAELAKLTTYEVVYKNENRNILDDLLRKSAQKITDDFHASMMSPTELKIYNQLKTAVTLTGVQARLPYNISIY